MKKKILSLTLALTLALMFVMAISVFAADYSLGNGTFAHASGANQITMENHSNAQVKAAFAFAPSVDTVTYSFSCDDTANNVATELANNAIVLDSATGKAANAPATATVCLNLSGSIHANQAGVIGTVTVAIGTPD